MKGPTPDHATSPTDGELVRAARRGEKRAFVEIVARHQALVCGVTLGILGNFAASEDAAQEAFLTAWRKAARFDASRGRLSTWLMAIAHNQAVDRLRRETGAGRPSLVLVEEVPERVTESDVEPVLERDSARRAMASLSDAERTLVVRAYFTGLTAREISEADGIPLGTVKTRLRTALIKLRRVNEGKEP